MKGGGYGDDGPCFDLLEIIERLHGADARDMVAARLGGLMVYVPRNPGPDNSLVAILGIERARAIAKEAHGAWSYVSGLRENRARYRGQIVLAHTLEGRRTWETAQLLGCSERTIQYIRARLVADGELPTRDQLRKMVRS